MAQIFNTLNQISSTVENLTLEHNMVNRAEWRKLLRLFSNVKTLHLDGELSHCLRLDVEEHPLELLPELQELTYSGSGNVTGSDVFTSFIDARKNAGRPVTLIES